jgi:chromosome partitioning protein
MVRNTIAVMNTKGGVGKSTLVLALAETLSAYHGKNVLVIDSDAQASVSSMLTSVQNLHKLQTEGYTLVDFLVGRVLHNDRTDWSRVVVRDVSDIDDSRTVFLIPSDMQLTLFEREVSKQGAHAQLRAVIAQLLADVRSVFDIVLIDCPPGLSVLTECWLREADFHISPTKADYVSVCGLEVFRRFKGLNPEMGFAENLGVVVNMKELGSPVEDEYHNWILANAENRCFERFIPRTHAMQDAARFRGEERSYFAKYPGYVGDAVRGLCQDVLARISAGAAVAATPASAAVPNDELAVSIAQAIEATRTAIEPAPAPAADVGEDTPSGHTNGAMQNGTFVQLAAAAMAPPIPGPPPLATEPPKLPPMTPVVP